MELTKQAILDYKHIINGLDGYTLIVSKIEGNVNINPDIAIESCRSLIEGLCLKSLSLFSVKYNSSKSFQKDCKQDLTLLTKTTFDEVYSNYVESQLHESLSNLLIDISRINRIKEKAQSKVKEQLTVSVGKIAAIRHERGDISHGRNYPKLIESSIILSKSIESICDGICSFMIHEMGKQFQEKQKEESKLEYSDLDEFNNWLDDNLNVLSVKVDFSKQLYLNAYDKYEEFYYTEYVDLIQSDEFEQTEDATIEVSLKPLEVLKDTNAEELKSTSVLKSKRKFQKRNTIGDLFSEEQLQLLKSKFETNEETKVKEEDVVGKTKATEQKGLSLSELLEAELIKPSKLTPEESKKLYEQHFPKTDMVKKEPVVLVNTFDENTFWTEKRSAELNTFANTHNLKLPELKEFINRYYFTEKEPRRDEVEKVMIYRPSLEDRRTELLVMVELIIELADELKTLEELK